MPEECPEEVERVISACRLVDPSARPTALDVYNDIFRSPTAPPPGVSLPGAKGAAAASGLERTSSGAASASAAASAQYTTGDRCGLGWKQHALTGHVAIPYRASLGF